MKRMKRAFALMLAALFLALLTAAVSAGAAYPVWVGGIQVTEANRTDVLGAADGAGATVTFDPQTNTLTLNGASILPDGAATGFGYGNNACGVKSELATLTVKLNGKTQIGKAVTGSDLGEYSVDNGIAASGDLVFAGDAASELVIYDYCVGIQAKNVTFPASFAGKVTVRDSGGSEPMPPCAINARGTFDDSTYEYLSDGTVTLLGGTFDLYSFESHGMIASGNITVKNADLTVHGAEGIISDHGDILIENTRLSVDTEYSAVESFEGAITLTGCPKVVISAGDETLQAAKLLKIAKCPDVRLCAEENDAAQGGDIMIADSTVRVTAQEDVGIALYTYAGDEGEYGKGSVTIRSGSVSARSGYIAIECTALSIEGKSDVYAAGDAFGVMIKGNEDALTLSGGKVRFTGKRAAFKLELEEESDPFAHAFPEIAFAGNTVFDDFTDLKDLTYRSEETYGTFSEYPYVVDAPARSVTAAHVHELVRMDGLKPTQTSAGFQSYYQCACGMFFEDAEGKTEIPDLASWKAVGGRGYLPPLGGDPVAPNTGDAGSVTAAALAVCASLAGVFTVCIRRKKDVTAE